jgi:hypothetical protein
MGWMIWVLEFDSRPGLGIFLFTTASRTALGPTQPPLQWVPGALYLGVKRPVREADHSPLSSAEVKNAWRYTSTPPYFFTAWCLVKNRDNFTFTYIGVRKHMRVSTCKQWRWEDNIDMIIIGRYEANWTEIMIIQLFYSSVSVSEIT